MRTGTTLMRRGSVIGRRSRKSDGKLSTAQFISGSQALRYTRSSRQPSVISQGYPSRGRCPTIPCGSRSTGSVGGVGGRSSSSLKPSSRLRAFDRSFLRFLLRLSSFANSSFVFTFTGSRRSWGGRVGSRGGGGCGDLYLLLKIPLKRETSEDLRARMFVTLGWSSSS